MRLLADSEVDCHIIAIEQMSQLILRMIGEMMHTKEPWKDKRYIDRFWSRVDIKGPHECWEWSRGSTVQGYGCFHFGDSSIRAHRFAYQQHNGLIREHDCVCHSCDNPRCVNPAHLWVGTRAENNADKEAKKRGVHPEQGSGEGNTNAVLTTPEVIAAKVMARKGMPQARIATMLGVSTATICMVVNGERRAEETERRVSACVNACDGVSDDMLVKINRTGGVSAMLARNVQHAVDDALATEQRDKLLAAIKEFMSLPEYRMDERNVIFGQIIEEIEATK